MELRRRRVTSENEPLLTDDTGFIQDENTNWGSSIHGASSTTVIDTKSYAHSIYELAWQYIAQFWAELRKRVIGFSPPDISAPTKQNMTEFQKFVTTPFEAQDPSHMSELYLLWKVVFPEIEVPSNIESELWKKLGFQSDNPLRDFRGSGIFGLKNMLFFAEKYSKSFFYLLDMDEKRPGEHYPFAVASFNITMMLFELLGWGWKTPGKSTTKNPAVFHRLVSLLFSENFSVERSENIFNELFSLSMVMVDKKWYEMKAGYMDFPKVLAQTQEQLEGVILQFNSLEDLFGYNKVLST